MVLVGGRQGPGPSVIDFESDIKITGKVLSQDHFEVEPVKDIIKSESRETKRI